MNILSSSHSGDEFDELDDEDAWYEELARNGYVTPESICNPFSSNRIWNLYVNWSN